MRVLRVYHGGRNPAHRARDHALSAAGIGLTLMVPAEWPEGGAETVLSPEDFRIAELPVRRGGDVNRHAYLEPQALARLLADLQPDILDIHEEPFSVAARQWIAAAPPGLPIVMYTAQNVDKRLPPPFARYERDAYARLAAVYPCSAQAASVVRGKGFNRLVEILPLGYDDALFRPGKQTIGDDELVLGLFGRLVPEKGVTDAVEVLSRVNAVRPARLVIVGNGPEEARVRAKAAALGLTDRLELVPWQSAIELAATYRGTHVLLFPSLPRPTGAEQFGRVIVEAHASGTVVAGYASGSIPEVAGDASILADVGAVAELGDRVAALVVDSDDFARRRALGIDLAATRTWTKVAERQADLYRRVVAGDVPRTPLPRSPRRRRALAHAEFGPTAATTAGLRPFALPLLRAGGPVVDVLGSALDLTTELVARLRRRSTSD